VLDLSSLPKPDPAYKGRRAVKTFLSDEAHRRLVAASAVAGTHMYHVVEELILRYLPRTEPLPLAPFTALAQAPRAGGPGVSAEPASPRPATSQVRQRRRAAT